MCYIISHGRLQKRIRKNLYHYHTKNSSLHLSIFSHKPFKFYNFNKNFQTQLYLNTLEYCYWNDYPSASLLVPLLTREYQYDLQSTWRKNRLRFERDFNQNFIEIPRTTLSSHFLAQK